jgi:hypothetical protein
VDEVGGVGVKQKGKDPGSLMEALHPVKAFYQFCAGEGGFWAVVQRLQDGIYSLVSAAQDLFSRRNPKYNQGRFFSQAA